MSRNKETEVKASNGTVEFEGLITALSPLYQSTPSKEKKGQQTMSIMSAFIKDDKEYYKRTDIPVLTAGAVRAMLRTNIALDLLEHIGTGKLDYLTLSLLITGGLKEKKNKLKENGKKEDGDVSPKIQLKRFAALKQMRNDNIILSLFGGGTGELLVAGKTQVTPCWPLTLETMDTIPSSIREKAGLDFLPCAADILGEPIYGMRRDVLLNPDHAVYMSEEGLANAMQRTQTKKDAKKTNGQKKTADDSTVIDTSSVENIVETPDSVKVNSAMLHNVGGYILQGTRLYNSIIVREASDIEIGAIYSALSRFARNGAVLGALVSRGFGRVNAEYSLSKVGSSGPDIDNLEINDCVANFTVRKYLEAYENYLQNVTADSITIPQELR